MIISYIISSIPTNTNNLLTIVGFLLFLSNTNNLYTIIWVQVIISISSLSSSHRAISTDILDPLLPPFSIVHCFQKVFRATSHISTELLYVGSRWLSCLCSSMWWGPQEYIIYEFILTSPAVSCMSGSSNFDRFRDGW